MRIFNLQSQKVRRKALRLQMPRAEILFWTKLQRKQFYGLKFRRQHGIGPYIVDFYCASQALVIEIDGESHGAWQSLVFDAKRQAYIESFGLRIVRFSNEDVLANIDGVLEKLSEFVVPPPLTPPQRGGVTR